MVEREPQFETQDKVGSTGQFSGTVGTTLTAVPASPGNRIAEALVRCANQTPNTVRLLVSFDGGTTFMELSPGEFVGWTLKDVRTEVHIKGSIAGVKYEILLNREEL